MLIQLIRVSKCHLITPLTQSIAMRSLSSSAASDPIQKLFVDKIREYNDKSKKSGDGLVDSSPQTVKDLKEEMERVARSYGIKDEKNLADLGLKFDATMELDSIDFKRE